MGASRAERAIVLAVLAGALVAVSPREARADDDDEDSGMRAPTVFFGGRLTTTSVRTGKDDVSSYGALFVTSASFHGTRGRYGSLRGAFIGAIGSGTATVEGWLRGALTLGLRVPLGDPWSGFVRAGFGGELQGNGNYFFSRLELPITEVGMQLREGERLLELGARGAAVLAGRYHVEGARPRDLGMSPEYGAYFSARTPLLRSEISAMLIDKRDDAYARPVQVVRALVCGFGVVGALLVCGDGEVFRVPNGGATTQELGGTRVFYLGLTFGYGETFRPAGADE